MNRLNEHIGSFGFLGDFYIPNSGGGTGDGTGGAVAIPRVDNKRIAGEEQVPPESSYADPERKINEESGFTRIQQFFTWEQFLSYTDWQGKNWRRSSQESSTKKYNHSDTWTFQEALDLARYGWAAGLRQKKEHERKILFTPQEQMGLHYERTIDYDVAGNSVDMGRYLTGMPDCMRHVKMPKEHVFPTRTQKIFVIDDTHDNTQTHEIINHGYTVYQIIEALELVNIRTELIYVHPSNKQYMSALNDYYFFETYIKLKNTEDVIYPEKIIFALAHPSMFRRLVLSCWEREPFLTRMTFGFYSGAHYGNYIEKWAPPFSMTKDALIIPGYNHKKEMEQLKEQVRKLIESQAAVSYR